MAQVSGPQDPVLPQEINAERGEHHPLRLLGLTGLAIRCSDVVFFCRKSATAAFPCIAAVQDVFASNGGPRSFVPHAYSEVLIRIRVYASPWPLWLYESGQQATFDMFWSAFDQ